MRVSSFHSFCDDLVCIQNRPSMLLVRCGHPLEVPLLISYHYAFDATLIHDITQTCNDLGSVLSRFLFALDDQIRFLLCVDCRQDSFGRKGRRFLVGVQVEHHLLSLFTRDYLYERLFVTCSFEHDHNQQ